MNWFYAQNGQQAGPVDDAELDRLVQAGTVADSTLVWHSGLSNWLPYASARVPVGAGAVPGNLPTPGGSVDLGKTGTLVGPGQTQCSQCGRVLPADEVVSIDNRNVCAECKPLFMQRLREGALVGSRYVYAGFGVRLGAAVLDGLILSPFYIVVLVAAFFMLGFNANSFQDQQFVQRFASFFGYSFGLINYVLLGCYSAFCLSRFGGTPGKRVCKLRVVRGDGQAVTFGRGFGRYSSKALPGFIPFLGAIYRIVDALFIVFDDQKRSLHDMICDTRVIHDDATAAATLPGAAPGTPL